MANPIFSSIKKGIDKIRSNPQLTYTLIVAVAVAGAFVFMSERFVGIASDAQERLINVRIGSLQDAFVSFAQDRFDDPAYLSTKIGEIKQNNETIVDFKVVASKDIEEMSKIDPQVSFLYTLASSDVSHSFTLEQNRGGERLFNTARAITDKSGNVQGMVMTTQTLSMADKAIEDDIKNSIALLVVVLVLIMLLFLRHSRIIDYVSLYKKLKEVDQMKDDFISMASHELRTPLSVIRGYAEFIRESRDLSADTKEYAVKIDSSAKDLDSLVADILDVSRIEQGRLSFKMENLNPKDMLADIVSSLELPAKEKGLSISFDKSGIAGDQVINADKDRLKQALVNVIGNAVKYTKTGEVKVRQYSEKGKLLIRVSDTGVGMSEEEKTKLFEKFYRIRTKDTEDIKGTGLGLWITAQIIEKMAGRISVESIKGVGSHFILSFPLVV